MTDAVNPAVTRAAIDDPLLAPWTGPHGGFPRFDRIRVDQLKPALLRAMELMRGEVAAIAANPAPASFDNTVLALEAAGRALSRASNVFGVYTSTLAGDDVLQLEQDMAPVFAAFHDEIRQNAALFARIRAVHDGRHAAGLTGEALRLVEVVYQSFARQGAALDPARKARLAEINARLAVLYTRFGQNELADEEDHALALTDEAELAGLPGRCAPRRARPPRPGSSRAGGSPTRARRSSRS